MKLAFQQSALSKFFTIRNITIISIILHILTAYFSTGFLQSDEHFQILEFLNWKLQLSPLQDLPWEFADQIRPWFQVLFYKAIYHLFHLLGITSPFTFAFIFRLITSLLGLWGLVRLFNVIKYQYFTSSEHEKIAWAIINFSWFIPYIQTRASSEGLSSAFFLLGTSYFLQTNNKHLQNGILSGLYFGISFLCRYQVAIMVASLWIYQFIKKRDLRLLYSFLMIILTLLLGIGIDYWGYGTITLSWWNYFYINIIEHKTAQFGVSPWWAYFTFIIKKGFLPIALLGLLSTLLFWVKYWNNPLTWITLPFIIFHHFIGHKELRFLFPVLLFIPIYLSILFAQYHMTIKNILHKRSWRYLVYFIIISNIILLVAQSFRSTRSRVDLYQYLYSSPIKTLHVLHDPFIVYDLPINYYRNKTLKIITHNSLSQLINSSPTFLLLQYGKHIHQQKIEQHCMLIYSRYPQWIINLLPNNFLNRAKIWSVFHCSYP